MLLHHPFDFHAQSRGDHVFAECEGMSLTYAEAKSRSDGIAEVLVGAGLRHGDRVACLMRNGADIALLMYAVSRLGVVAVPLNYRLAPREWAALIADSTARVILADAEFHEALDVESVEITMRIGCGGGSGDWIPLDTLLAGPRPALPPVAIDGEDILFQMYTSGTTGRPKGALLSHRCIMASMFQGSLARPYSLSPGDRILIALPMFHASALTTALGAASSGATLVIHKEVDPLAIVCALADDRIAVSGMVPAVLQFMLTGVPGIADMRFPHLKFLGYGAAPIAEPVLRQAMAVFGCHFAQGYGMTELAGSCCMLTEADHARALAGRPELLRSTGRPLPGVELCIAGPDGEDLAPGETGEILVRGPQMMSGYWNMPAETAAATTGGWMHTGDAGYIDVEGYLYIRDRVKDMIVSGAENIYPAEIEAVLYGHPAIAEAAVIGVPDPRWGETVMAVVALKPGMAAEAAELDGFCRDRLGGFKVPRRYRFVEALPRNAAGKILKRELRAEFWDEGGRQIG